MLPSQPLVVSFDADQGLESESAFLRQLFDGVPIPPSIRFRLGDDVEDSQFAKKLAVPGAIRHALGRAVSARVVELAKATPIVLVIDNAHRADHAILDGLELAVLPETNAPIAVLVAAMPSIDESRPAWGSRCGAVVSESIGPLGKDDAIATVAELLKPAEYVPKNILERLWTLSEGNPLYLSELTASIRVGGAIRQHDRTGTWYVEASSLLGAASQLSGGSSKPILELLANSVFERVPAVFHPALEIAVVLGDSLELGAARRLRDAGDDGGIDVGNIEVGAGLGVLVRCNVLVAKEGGHFRFRHPLLRRALEKRLDAGRQRQLHGFAFELVTASNLHGAKRSAARHALAAGYIDVGVEQHVALGEQARAAHRTLDAEEHFTTAIEWAASSTDLAAIVEGAYAGRGRVRHACYREREALDDLAKAAELAMARGANRDRCRPPPRRGRRRVDCLMDWNEQAACLERAEQLIKSLDDPHLQVRATLRRGVVEYRAQNLHVAKPLLADAAKIAGELGDVETETVALMVLATLFDLPRATTANRKRVSKSSLSCAGCQATGRVSDLR